MQLLFGLVSVSGVIDQPEAMRGDPGQTDLLSYVAEFQSGGQPLTDGGAEPVGAAAQDPPDAVERFITPAAVPGPISFGRVGSVSIAAG